MKPERFALLCALTAALALTVILLGAYVRLSDAGLGCPDWPGCYGRLAVPGDEASIAAANAAWPERPVATDKAWKEMVHRYLASGLGLAIVGLAIGAWRSRGAVPATLPTLLVGLVVFQGLLGMWTVTLLVKPAVVTAHLAGGLATLALLWWLALRTGGWLRPASDARAARLRPWIWSGLAVLCVQIFLGGWTSTNYAAVACTELPTCWGGLWWPPTDFRDAFVLWRGTGVDYEFGVLDSAARTAIHLTHRIGALVVLLYLGTLALVLARGPGHPARRGLGVALGVALLVQVGLGIANVLAHLPLPVAVAHNGGAAVLLLVLVTLLHATAAPARVCIGARQAEPANATRWSK